tara:strand:+ start:770 stop:1441 length:672 start_codon:yes stop_codon:yes gene_type:complete
MKKILIALFAFVISFSPASAEKGINIGLSGQLGLFAATASETDTGTHGTTSGGDEGQKDSDFIGLGYSSMFIEKELGRVAIGVEYVPTSLATETSQRVMLDKTTSATAASVTNNVQVDFDDLTTFYLALNVTDNMYVKAGMMTVDVITNETLGTGSTYANTDLDGTSLGVGYHRESDNGLFVRVEGNYMDFDGASLTSSSGSQKISLDSLHGISGKIAVGKAF